MKKYKFPKSAKDILISNDFLEAREKTAKHIHHEFQDYGYRLANDLGDLSHVGIYMRLAKTEDRTLLEQAAAFALGYFDERNKGKIFMWKVQQLRRLRQQKQDMQNTDHSFVMKRMAQIIDDLSDLYAAVQRRDHTPEREQWLSELAAKLISAHPNIEDPAKFRVLVLGCGIGLEVDFLHRLGLNTFGADISRKLLQVGKQKSDNPNRLVRKPDMLDSKYKDNYFHMVIVMRRFWELVPIAAEPHYLAEIDRITKPDAVIAVELGKINQDLPEATDGWEKFNWQEQEFIRFRKSHSPTCGERVAALIPHLNLHVTG